MAHINFDEDYMYMYIYILSAACVFCIYMYMCIKRATVNVYGHNVSI